MLEALGCFLKKVVRLPTLTLLSDQPNWSYNEDRGWYKDIHHPDATWSNQQTLLNLTSVNLSQIKYVRVTFTGYFNTPEGSLGQNLLIITLDDNSTIWIGTSDGMSEGGAGQSVHDGVSSYQTVENIINKTMTARIPTGRTVKTVGAVSNGYTLSINYPFSIRGFRDVILGI